MSLQVWLPLKGDLHNQGLNQNLTISNHNATINNNGKIGKCYYFDGNQQWLQFNSSLGNFYNNDWSITCWIKPTDRTRSVILSEYSAVGASNIALELLTSGHVRVYWNGAPDINFTSAGILPLNEWTHLTVTKQNRDIKVYFNGEWKSTYTHTDDFSTRISNAYPRIGDDYRGNSNNTVSYQGYLNDFRMYNHCLSPKEVEEISKGLVLHYPLNQFNNNIIYDTSGYCNNGEIIGSITSTTSSPRYNCSTFFDGNTACIKTPYNNVCPENIFTINLWFKKDSLGTKNYETLFGGPRGFEMDTRQSSESNLSLYMASIRGGKVFHPFSFGQWYMITMVRDGVNELYYVNGELKATITAKDMPTGDYYIGAWKTETQQNYKGNIVDFRIYTTILTDSQIQELYNTSMQIDSSGNIFARELVEL